MASSVPSSTTPLLRAALYVLLAVGVLLALAAGVLVQFQHKRAVGSFVLLSRRADSRLQGVWEGLRRTPPKEARASVTASVVLLRMGVGGQLLQPVHHGLPIPPVGSHSGRRSTWMAGEDRQAQRLWKEARGHVARGEIAAALGALRKIPAGTRDAAGLPFDLLVPYRLWQLGQTAAAQELLGKLASARYPHAFRRYLLDRLSQSQELRPQLQKLRAQSRRHRAWAGLAAPGRGAWKLQTIEGRPGLLLHGSRRGLYWISLEALRSYLAPVFAVLDLADGVSYRFQLRTPRRSCPPDTRLARGLCLSQTRAQLQAGPLALGLARVDWLQPGLRAWLLGGLALLVLLLLAGGVALTRLWRRELQLREQQQRFAAAVAHELRSPLTSLGLSAEMLVEGGVPPERLGRYHQRIQQQVGRLQGVVENVLSYYRSGQKIDPEQRADLVQVVEQVLGSMAGVLEAAGHRLEVSYAQQQGPQLPMSPDGLARVLRNLLDNAMTYAPQSPIEIRVGPGARLEVADKGPGVPEGLKASLFEPFAQGHRPEGGGLGLGLALVAEVMQRSGGQIQLLDSPQGARFLLEWSLKDE